MSSSRHEWTPCIAKTLEFWDYLDIVACSSISVELRTTASQDGENVISSHARAGTRGIQKDEGTSVGLGK